MESYKLFIEKFIKPVLSPATSDMIADKISTDRAVNMVKYGEDFIVHKPSGSLVGKLYMMFDGSAVRVNHSGNMVHSIDSWEHFKFNNETITSRPDYTLHLNGNDVETSMGIILSFATGEMAVSESVQETAEPIVTEASNETVQLKSMTVNKRILDKEFDIFEAMTIYTRQVAYGISNSLVISGMAGVGKSYGVGEIVKEANIKPIIIKGKITTAGLYEALFVYNDKLIIFDDCDAVWGDEDSENILKAALDTNKDREISSMLKTHYDGDGKTYDEMLTIFKETGKLPKQFIFTGRCIFITNKNGSELDKAFKSRSLFIDVQLTREQVIARITKILSNMFPDVKPIMKQEALEFVEFIVENYEAKLPLSIRTMVHAINIRRANDYPVYLEGEKIPAWQPALKLLLMTGEIDDDKSKQTKTKKK